MKKIIHEFIGAIRAETDPKNLRLFYRAERLAGIGKAVRLIEREKQKRIREIENDKQ